MIFSSFGGSSGFSVGFSGEKGIFSVFHWWFRYPVSYHFYGSLETAFLSLGAVFGAFSWWDLGGDSYGGNRVLVFSSVLAVEDGCTGFDVVSVNWPWRLRVL